MSKANQSVYYASSSPEPMSSVLPIPDVEQPVRREPAKADTSILSKGLFFKGEITGTNSLFIDGIFEGAINLAGGRVTIGHNGQVGASITAHEIVVSGKIRGNVSALDRVDIRAEGVLRGDVAAARIRIADGAFFKGGIDIRKPVARLMAVPARSSGRAPQAPQS